MKRLLWKLPRWIHYLVRKVTGYTLVKSTSEDSKVVTYWWTKYYLMKCDVCGSSQVRYKEMDWNQMENDWVLITERYGCKDHKPAKGKLTGKDGQTTECSHG